MKSLAIASGLCCTAALLLSTATSASAQNLVVNGSFEEPGLQFGSWRAFDVGEVNGWTPTQGSRIEIRNNVVGTTQYGDHFVELDSHYYDVNIAEVGLFQDIVTEVGKTYNLSFSFAPRESNSVNGDNLLAVSFGDFYQELDAGNNGDGWQFFSQSVTATSNSTRLKFLSLGKRDTLGANIDNVRVETAAVPEPASLLGLAFLGAFGATSTLRKRFNA